MRAAAALIALVLVAACRLPGESAQATPSGHATPTAGPSGGLDAEVPMPAGFPADVPVYNGARLTAAAQFTGPGELTWGMEWETRDTADKVQKFYTTRFAQGDWTLGSNSTTNGIFFVKFARKSNSHFAGTVGIDGSSGVTKISMSLVGPSS